MKAYTCTNGFTTANVHFEPLNCYDLLFIIDFNQCHVSENRII